MYISLNTMLCSSPSEVASPFCEVNCDWDVAHERDKHNDGNPGLQCCSQVHASSCNVKDLRPDVEDDGRQDALYGVGTCTVKFPTASEQISGCLLLPGVDSVAVTTAGLAY